MLADSVLIILILFLGTSVGSFLNVVIDRLPNGKSIVHGRSVCDHCQRKLLWWEMVPLLSYLALGGRCSTCNKKLSIQYPIIEGFVGVLLVVSVSSSLGNVTHLLYLNSTALILMLINLSFISSLVAVSIIDIKHGIIPDEITLFLIWLFGLREIVGAVSVGWTNSLSKIFLLGESILENAIPAVCAGAFFWALVILSEKILKRPGMGGGDVKLAFVIGLFLTSGQTLIAVYVSFLVGGLLAAVMLLIGKRRFGQTLPFGPFLATGAVLALLYGEQITNFYLTWLRGI